MAEEYLFRTMLMVSYVFFVTTFITPSMMSGPFSVHATSEYRRSEALEAEHIPYLARYSLPRGNSHP